MRFFFLLFVFYLYSECREQGPPPIDGGLFNEYEYYYDLYINETMLYLPDLDPKYSIFQAVYISGPLKVTPRELTIFFKNIEFFRYGIRVHNTNLENLSFLKPYNVDILDDTKNSIEITDNYKLTSLGINFESCTFCYNNIVITNNSKLDLRAECDGIIKRYGSYRTISDNLMDCGCAFKGSFNNYVKTMATNCWMLFGNVTIDQNSDLAILQEKMANVTRINGGLSITNTNFTNLSFLSSIEWIQIDAYKSQYLANIVITNNTNLVSLNMTAKRDGLYLTIRNNPKLCITTRDLDNLFYALSLDSDLDINVCFDNETPSHWCKLPDSGNFNKLPDGCLNLTGNLVFDENFDFENSYKLYDVGMLYGSLTIKNSSLRTLNMLPKLERIKSIKDNIIPLHVYNNSRMTVLFDLFDFKGIESGMAATIENNDSLDIPLTLCSFMRTRKSAIVKNNRDNCQNGAKVPRRKYDRTPLNIDVYKGVPVFPDVSHSEDNPSNSGGQKPVWENNSTDSDYYGEEVEATTKIGFNKNYFIFPLVLIVINM